MVGYHLFNTPWSSQRVLVISPHPDDDVIACGGTIARAASEGAALRVLYITDGSASHVGSRKFPPERLRALREDEARKALQILGVTGAQAHFLRESDTRLQRSGPDADALVARIAAHLGEFVPTIVFSPWIRDGHGDHVAASAAVRRALAHVDSSAMLCEYTVWLEDFGTLEDAPRPSEAEPFTVEVSAFRKRKARAIASHQSQLGHLIDDAELAFALPERLLRRTEVDVERFYRILPHSRMTA